MSSNRWTDEQKAVIAQRGDNLLVAAAAGSGKTAVMVERIITKILDENNPVDVDRLVVVTFTNAAAAEMKERIARKLLERMNDEESSERKNRIRRQIALLDNARITTIDSFCLFILRNYFNIIDLDPSFRVGDEAELKMIKAEAVDNVIEKAYEQEKEEFIDFIESYIRGKKDQELSEWIISFAGFAESSPYPKEWLEACRDYYNTTDVKEFAEHGTVKNIIDLVKLNVAGIISEIEYYADECSVSEGLEGYAETLECDKVILSQIQNANDYSEMRTAISAKFPNSKRAKKGCDEELKEAVSNMRKAYKKKLDKMFQSLFVLDAAEQVKNIMDMKLRVNAFIDLTLEYVDEYDRLKADKNLVSFSDAEHLALKMLYGDNQVAEELSNFYEEIYIDEYQDSNMVQELILKAVSRETDGHGNMFMVGDIKQSIYRFRQADPTIFLEKLNTYTGNSLILLDKNFRSRKNVLVCANEIFERIMHSSLGGVEYDENAKLKNGKSFAQCDAADDVTELLLYDKDYVSEEKAKNSAKTDGMDSENEDNSSVKDDEMDNDIPDGEISTDELDSIQAQAAMVALRIKEMMNTGMMVWDDKLAVSGGGYRKVKYSDIVILLRSANTPGPVYTKYLADAGIPAVCTTSSGYFSSKEIKTILNVLSVIDNPRQDIALAGALRSFFCYLSGEELTMVKGIDRKGYLYDCVLKYHEAGADYPVDNYIWQKLDAFLHFLSDYRDKASYMPIHELVRSVIEDTQFVHYAAAMPSGKMRTANLRMLVDKAKDYENTSFNGLFNFLKYIEKMRKYEIDLGSANVLSENDNVVRIMSIHKSKGLEFPVVFMCDMQKKYNLQELNEKLIWDEKYGLGLDYVNLNSRIEAKTFIRNAVAEKKKVDAIGEELRILYVGITRAVEKLILVGKVKKYSKKEEEWTRHSKAIDGDFNYVYEHLDYLDLVAPAFYGENSAGKYFRKIFGPDDLKNTGTDETEKKRVKDIVRDLMAKEDTVPNLTKTIRQRFEWQYSHEGAVFMPAKVSVSDIKHQKIEENESEEVRAVVEKKKVEIPAFLQENLIEKEQSEDIKPVDESGSIEGKNYTQDENHTVQTKIFATDRGNAYHKLFEILDYSVEPTRESVQEFINASVEAGRLSEIYASCINPMKFVYFLNSELGKRMKTAWETNNMYREQQFVAGFKAGELYEKYQGIDDMMLLQGIIDCYFVENGKAVVVDYKTDHVNDEGEQMLKERYSKQLELYAATISKMTGLPVAECIIYSVAMNKEIKLSI